MPGMSSCEVQVLLRMASHLKHAFTHDNLDRQAWETNIGQKFNFLLIIHSIPLGSDSEAALLQRPSICLVSSSSHSHSLLSILKKRRPPRAMPATFVLQKSQKEKQIEGHTRRISQ